jgi:hypothetical protein
LGLLPEPTYRLYNCRRCAVQVRICAQCDRGNIYPQPPQITARKPRKRSAVLTSRKKTAPHHQNCAVLHHR